jgi:NAD(P)H-dependent FMN reductase
MAQKPHIQIILGSTRKGRQGDKVAKWVHEEAQKQDDFTVELVDLVDHPLPFFDENPSPAYLKGNYTHPEGKAWAELVGKADGYIVVTPEYNHGYPAVLKNALDWVYKEWNNKPMAVVSYSSGPIGGARAVQELRTVAIELQMAPLRGGVHVGGVTDAFDETGKPKEERYQKALESMFEHLMWWTKALKVAREQ